MEITEITSIVFGLGISIISYFLKSTISDVKTMKELVYTTKSKMEVMENDYINKIKALDNKFDLLYSAIEKLSEKIEELNRSIK